MMIWSALKRFFNKYSCWFDQLFIDSDDADGQFLSRVLSIVLLCGGGFLLVLLLVDIVFLVKDGDVSTLGPFGDFLGGVLNPVLTFLTLFGLIATIVIQKKELRLARVGYEKTADALSTQAVEVTFFNILDLHHKIADSLRVDLREISGCGQFHGVSDDILVEFVSGSDQSVFEGRQAFDGILSFISYRASGPEEVVRRYKMINDKNNHLLEHYFRNLYQALKIIHNHDERFVSIGNKHKYASVLRSQLSSKELAILFVNCLEGVSDRGEFKNLLIEYSMLEHLPVACEGDSFLIADSFVASGEMMLEYKWIKSFEKFDFTKYYGGAFGNNRSIPYELKRREYRNEFSTLK